MSVYNGEKYLAEAVDSMLNQTYTSFEFIIVDDASTDSTPEILARFAEGDDRIMVCRNDVNLGLTKSLNKGLAIAAGEYVVRMDADDVSLPQRLEKQVGFLDSHPEAVLVTGWIQSIDAEGNYLNRLEKEVEPDMVNWFLMFYNYIGGHGQAAFRRSTVMDVGCYDEKLRYSQDYELWTRICAKGELHLIPEVMILYRRHENNISVLHDEDQEQCSLQVSRAMMSRIMEEPPEKDAVASLRRFWQWEFESAEFMTKNHAAFCSILAAFDTACAGDNTTKRLFIIRHLIGQQFLRWATVLMSERQVFSSLKAALYAAYWLRWRIVGRFLARVCLPKSEVLNHAETE